MKFGRSLTANQVPEWREHYLAYDSLKAVLKQVCLVFCQRLCAAFCCLLLWYMASPVPCCRALHVLRY